MSKKITVSKAIGEALHEEMLRDEKVFIMGEDMAVMGNVFAITKGFLEEFGPNRVIDTPISEEGFVGMAVGAAMRGLRPVVELGLPLEEIRQMQHGAYTVGDGMRRHLVSLERERQNLEAAIRFCGTLTDRRERLEELDAQSLLDRMAQMEQEGTTFMNKQKQDTRRRRFVAPIVVAIVMSVLMAGLIWLFLWAFEVDPAGAPPLPVLALFVAIPAAVVVGVVIALVQRVREIERGEEDDARNY